MRLRIAHIIFCLFAFTQVLQAQCPNDNIFIGDMTPSCPGTSSNSCVQGGWYVTVNVVQDNVYTFSTCGDTDFDTQLTVYNGGTVVAFDDDGCGLQSTITWTATFTGTVSVLLDEYDWLWGCDDNSGCMTLDISCALPAGSCAGGPVCTGATADICETACSLGTLNAPNACPDGTGTTQSWCGSNIGATAANPYQYQLNCSGGGDMPTFIPEVWYTFTPQGNSVVIEVDGLANPSIGLWDGDCAGLAGIGCANGTGSASLTVEPVIPGNTYYLQVSGGDVTDVDDFQLSITNSFNCDICLTEASISVDPPPTNGFYQDETPVTFCYTIDTWVQQNINWLHGVQIDFGAGWNQSTLTTVPAASASGNGTWSWYNNNVVSEAGNGTFPPGFYFESPSHSGGLNSPTNPGDSWGDNGTGGWEFCWTVSTQNCPPGTDGMDLGISVTTTADGESGDWTSIACTPDPEVAVGAILTCCPDPLFINLVNNDCSGDCDGSITVEGVGTGPFNYTWIRDSNGATINTDNNNAGSSTLGSLCAGSYTIQVEDQHNSCLTEITETVTEPSPVVGNLNSTNPVDCNGASTGSAIVSASGGTAPYSFNFGSGPQASGSFNDLSAGNYTVNILDDSNCATSVDLTISEPPVVVGSVDATTNADCNGTSTGSATISASGGTPPFTFDIGSGPQASGTFNSLSAGNYTINILDDNDCPTSVSFTITEPTPVVGSLDATVDADCNGASTGSATVSAAGGTPPFTFNIGAGPVASGNFTSLSAGAYSVTVLDDNGCSDVVPFNINEPTPVVGAVQSQTDPTCFNGTDGEFVLTASGGTPNYMYDEGAGAQTSGTFSGNSAGTYSVDITDANGCSSAVSIILGEPTEVVGAIDNQTDASCSGMPDASVDVSASGGTPPYTFDIGNGAQASGSFGGLTAGAYTVTVEDAVGCQNTISVDLFEPVSLTANIVTQTEVSCFAGTDGSVEISAQDGTGPYAFDIGNGPQVSGIFNGLSAGNHTVTVADDNGCSVQVPVVITEPTEITSSIISQSDLTCFGSNDGQFEVAASGGTAGYAYNIGTGPQPTGVFIDLNPATYTVTVVDANACQTTIDIVISEPIPLVIDAGTDITICNGDVATLSAMGADTYSWSPIADLSNPLIGNPDFDGSSTTTLTVTGTDINGCIDTDDVTVTVNPLPTVNAGADDEICIGFNVQLAATGADSYVWNSSANLDNATISNPTFSGTSTETITVTGTDLNGCVNTDDITVTVNPLPVIDAGSDIAICIGSTTQLTASGASSYVWNPSTDLDDANITNPTFDGAVTSTITVTGTDANGCVNTDDVTVTVNALLVVDAGLDTEICVGESAQLLATGGVSYSWNPTTGLDNPLVENPTFSGANTTTFTVTVTDANGCTNTDDVTITVNPLPIVDAGADEVICTDFSVQLGASGATTYAWNAATNLDNATLQNPTFSGTATETLTVIGTDANGCSNSDDVTVTVNDLPVVDAGPDQTICDGQSVQLQASGGASYSWGPQNGLNNYAISDPTFSGTNTTTYTVTSIDGNGCTDSDQITITVNAILPVNAGNDTAICIGETVQLQATGASTYVWSPAADLDNPNIANPVYSGTNTTTFAVTGTDANGCNATDDVTVTVNPLPIIDAGLDEAICIGNQIQLSVSGALTYDWAPATDLDNAQSSTPTFSGTATTLLTVIGTDLNGCFNTDDVNVTVNPLPVIDAGSDVEICSGFTFQLGANGATNYAWSPATDLDNANISNPIFSGLNTTTYTVTGTDGNGCVNTNDVTLTVNGLPVADAGADVEICIGETTQLNASGASNFAWSPATGLDNATVENPTFSGSTTTLFTVTVTDDSGCEDTDEVEVTVHALPIIDAGIDEAICIGNQVQLSVSGALNYVWSPAADLDDETSATPTFSGTSTTVIAVTGTDVNGCINTDDVEVTVNPLPLVDAGLDDAICFGETSQLGASGATTYTWNPAADLDNSTIANPTFSGGNTTTLTVTGTDGNGCVNTDNVTVTVNQLPAINAGADQAICEEESAQLDAIGNGSFVWFPGGSLSNPTISNPVATPSTTEEYVVRLTDASGCLNTDTVIITVMLNPTAVIVANTEACEAEPIDFQSTSTGNIVTTTWVLGDGNSESATSFSHNYSTEGTYQVVLAVTTDEGCSDVTTQNIDIHPNPTAVFSVTNACLIEDVNFTDESTVSSGSITIWDWDFGDSNSSASLNPSHNYATQGTYSVELLVETGFGCADSITNNVTVYPMPVADYAFTNACADEVATVTDNSSIVSGAITQWEWVLNQTDTLVGQSPNLGIMPVGIYSTQLTVWSDQGCSNSLTQDLEVYPLPTADFTATIVCEGLTTEFTDLSTGTAIYPVDEWNWVIDGTQTSTVQNPTYTYGTYGNNLAVLEVTNTAGCSTEITQNDILVHPAPIVDFDFTSHFCENDSVFFTQQSSVPIFTNDSLVSWNWSFDEISSASGETSTYAFDVFGDYEVILEVSTNNGCINTDTQNVHINPLPVAIIAGNQFEGCQILPIQFWSESTIEPGYNLASWAWTFGDGTDTAFVQHPGHDFLGALDGDTSTFYYDVSLTVTSSDGCVASVLEPQLITVHANPTALFEANHLVTDLNNPRFLFTDLSSENVVDWDWDFGDGDFSYDQDPQHIYGDTGYYPVTLTVSTINDCVDMIRTNVLINPIFTFYIPNSFTPDGDGINDEFFGQGIGIKEYNMYVYDRWGEEIFYSNEYDWHWDGTFKGKQVEQGVYVYRFHIIDWQNHSHNYTDGVTLHR